MKTIAASLLAVAPLVRARALPSISSANHTTQLLSRAGPQFEWTAWGDSYASGVGAGNYIDGYRCLRYDSAYPPLIQADPDDLFGGPGGGKFNNVVCSGAKAEEVELYQFYEEEQTWPHPDPQYYPRHGAGKPTMGTLTVGGDDIDFPGILNFCIIEGFPFPLNLGFIFKRRTCEQQIALSWSLISQDGNKNEPNDGLVGKVTSVIQKALQYGQRSGGNFRLYVTGYGQFFIDQDTGCDGVTFARIPSDSSRKLTTENRADFNHMSRTLNAAIQKAVQSSGDHVKYIDIDTMVEGHRFCEPGANEPNESNENLWFYHFPYGNNDDATNPVIQYLNSVAEDNVDALSWDPESTLYVDVMNDFWSKVSYNEMRTAIGAPPDDSLDDDHADAAAKSIWDSIIGYRAKLFHPQPAYHKSIYNAIVSQYKSDAGDGANPGQAHQTCNKNSVSAVPQEMAGADGTIAPRDLLFSMRQVICSDKCEKPAGLPDNIGFATGHATDGDCEIAVSIVDNVEAYMYRTTPSQGEEWQNCWDETAWIIDECVQNGPNEGWVNGPYDYQFYKGGFRPLNSDQRVHDPITSGDPLGAPAQGATVGAQGDPNDKGIFCGTDPVAGTNLADCLTSMVNGYVGDMLFPLSDTNTTEGICTDSDFCAQKGDSKGGDGSEDYGDYCQVLTSSDCGFVLATKDSKFGFPGRSCVSPAQVNQALRDMAYGDCSGGDDAWAAKYKENEDYTLMALVQKDAAAQVAV